MVGQYALLFAASLMTVVGAIGLFCLDKFTSFKRLNFWVKQVIFGIIFGLLAIAGTHCGIPFYGAQANVRDASVIVAGLAFGWPAALIAGLIASLERWLGVMWFGLGSTTVIACCVSTALAGICSALLNRFMYDRKRANVISGVLLTIVIEIFHLLMVFVTNARDYETSYNIINSCTAPMLIGNAVGVFLSLFLINVIDKKKAAFKAPDHKNLTHKMQISLGALCSIAFVLSSLFIYQFQNEVTTRQTENDLTGGIGDTVISINDKADDNMLQITHMLVQTYESNPASFNCTNAAATYNITEVNIISGSGFITASNIRENIGFNMVLGGYQSLEFKPIWTHTSETGELVQAGMPIARDPSIWRKYAAVSFPVSEGCLQIGYSDILLQSKISTEIKDITEFTSIGEKGGLIVLDTQGNIVSRKYDLSLDVAAKAAEEILKKDPAQLAETMIGSEKCYAMHISAENYTIIAYLPEFEANLSRNISMYIYIFLEVVIFGLVFVLVFFLIKIIVNNRLNKINASLADITNGKLDEEIEQSSTTEFKELGNGINTMVTALKGYIDEAAKRIDKELAFAKSIQTNALPNVFPDRDNIDCYAFMKTAKQVGGDFYDFYFNHTHTFNFAIADVSGKGIPAALFMMRAKTELKGLTEMDRPLDEVFYQANNTLCDGNDAGMFVTAWQAKVDLITGRLQYVNAGHNPPLIRRAGGKFEYLHSKPNLVLAMMDNVPYQINEIQLEEGDTIFLYTDGVTESINHKLEQFGEERLLNILNTKDFFTNYDRCNYIYKKVVEFCDGEDQFDDISMVAFTLIKKDKGSIN